MTVLVVPPLDEDPWPTLGPQVCEFIESYLIHGPGDIRGRPAQIDDETRGLIYRAYEVYPRAHPQAGRRRFKTVGWSLRKGTAKTEKAAWVAACELHHEGPVRCDGWKKVGKTWVPVGAPVMDPYIPMVAYTEEQTEELAYGALYVMLAEGPLADDFDIGKERITRIHGDGKAVPLATAPDSRDGARTSFQHFDESHRMTTDRLREGHQTMQGNIPKRFAADAWSLETTTAFMPGERSVAEGTMDYARAVDDGRISDSRLFFFHRQAADEHDLSTEEGARAAVLEASGPAAAWSDIESILALWSDPRTDRAYWERVWTNRVVQGSAQAFDVGGWRDLAREFVVPEHELVTAGFDGARFRDATALVATHVESGQQFTIGVWERPLNAGDEWEIDVAEVDAAVAYLFETWEVWRLYADPPYWDTQVSEWAGTYGTDRVVRWHTKQWSKMAYALRAYRDSMQGEEVHHDAGALVRERQPNLADSDDPLTRHIGNARRHELDSYDDQGKRLWIIRKEREDSPAKIDGAMAGTLSWTARTDAIAAGANRKRKYIAVGF